MSLSANYPALAPNLLLDFSNSAVVDPRVTVTRASTATYYNGLTYAKAEQNLLIRSQDFNVGGWSATGCVMTGDALAAPDGTTTAELLTANVTGTSGISQSITTGAVPHTFSVFAKAGTCTWLRLLSVTGTNNAWFDLTNGVVGTVQGSTTATITSVGNGWYRCSVTSSVGGATAFIRLANADASTTANDTTTLYIWGAQLEQRSSVTAYTATTTQPITNYIQALQTAQNNVPRIDHNPVTNATLGLLIEEQRTNSLTYSEQFDNAAWSKDGTAPNNVTIQNNIVISPDGTQDADKLVERPAAAGSVTHGVFRFITPSAGAITFSCFVKAAGRTQVNLNSFEASVPSNPVLAYFDLSAGTVISTGGLTTSASITSVGNGWFRCVVSGVVAGTQTSFTIRPAINGSATYTGDGYSGIYIWGAQLEVGAFPTSYIPTTTTALTRNSDVLSLTGTNFSSWYSAGEGAIFTQASTYSVASNRIVSISDGTGSNRLLVLVGTSDFIVTAGGVAQASINSGSYTANVSTKGCAAYKQDDFAASLSGGSAVTDTSGSVPTGINRMTLGANELGTDLFLNGHIQRIAYYPLRNTNAQLQALTG